MKLNRVAIENFRSIKSATISLAPPCRVLVGINESGKSNVLNALALLSTDRDPVSVDDLREPLPNEAPIAEAYVRFIFRFEKADSDQLFADVSLKILSATKDPDIATSGGPRETLREFCAARTESLYVANILTQTKYFSHWALDPKYELLPGWMRPTSACPDDFGVPLGKADCRLKTYHLVRIAGLPSIPEAYLEPATVDDLSHVVGAAIKRVTQANLPDCRFWEYSDTNLLPTKVNIATFAANPDTCLALKNMFLLAGIDNIGPELTAASNDTHNRFQNYLDRVAQKTTNHFRAVWKEYKGVDFSLKAGADSVVPGVKEKNVHDFARRSDGFKRFVSFLLMISVNVKTEHFRDTLLLVDEPEVGLHPMGARYLRDELIRISKSNYVVYSTHSIFMVDAGDVERHIIVRKKNEMTTLDNARESNVADEEVLYNALGYSVFAVLKPKNIIFEGWKDKRLFSVALGASSPPIQRKFKDVGLCHARGARSIKTITPMIELAGRGCAIISDSDAPAREQQKLYRSEQGYGEWTTYQDVDASIQAVTGEDFVRNDVIVAKIQVLLAGKGMPTCQASELPLHRGKADAILRWLTTNGMTKDQARESLVDIKNLIFEKLSASDIDEEYKKMLSGIQL